MEPSENKKAEDGYLMKLADKIADELKSIANGKKKEEPENPRKKLFYQHLFLKYPTGMQMDGSGIELRFLDGCGKETALFIPSVHVKDIVDSFSEGYTKFKQRIHAWNEFAEKESPMLENASPETLALLIEKATNIRNQKLESDSESQTNPKIP